MYVCVTACRVRLNIHRGSPGRHHPHKPSAVIDLVVTTHWLGSQPMSLAWQRLSARSRRLFINAHSYAAFVPIRMFRPSSRKVVFYFRSFRVTS